MTEVQQRAAAKDFASKWKDRGRERADSQPFWLSLLRDVYGVEHPEDLISFESSDYRRRLRRNTYGVL